MKTIITEKELKKVHVFIGLTKKNNLHGDTFDSIPMIDEINEPKTDDNGITVLDKREEVILVPRTIRFIPGERSIYADEQPYKTNKEAMDASKGTSIQIRNNLMYVDGSEINKLLFLRKSNFNANNPYRKANAPILFKEYNPEEAASKANEDREIKIEALHRAKNMDITEVKAILLVLRNDINYAETLNKMSISELRHEAYRLADAKPDLFVKGIETPEMKNKFHVMNSINLGYINYDKQTNRLIWGNGDEICRGSLEQSAIDTFVRLVSVDTKYESIMEEIKNKSMSVIEKASNKPEKVEQEKPVDWLETWINQKASEGKLNISDTKTWITYKSKNGEDVKFKGIKSFKDELMKDGMKLFNEINSN